MVGQTLHGTLLLISHSLLGSEPHGVLYLSLFVSIGTHTLTLQAVTRIK